MIAEFRRYNLPDQVQSARRRFDDLYQRFTTAPSERNLPPESLHELSNALEALCVASEELQQQNDELVATRGLLEEQRQHFQELFEFAPDGDRHGQLRGDPGSQR